ncbi:hypothetical protein CON22_18110 [Bacillus cereus]|nr:hypothetical protein CON22_18110 [Bacillus cereus]
MNKLCSIVLAFTLLIGMLSTVLSNFFVVEAAETNNTPIQLVMMSNQQNAINSHVNFKLLVDSESTKAKDEVFSLDYSTGLKLNIDKVVEDNKGTIEVIEHSENDHKLTFKLISKSPNIEVSFESVAVSAGTFHLNAKSEKLTSNELVINIQDEENSNMEQVNEEKESSVNKGKKEEQFAASWSIDDPGDLDGWEQIGTNKPIEFPVKNSKADRKYFMYFGSINTYSTTGEGNVNWRSDLDRPIPSSDMQGPDAGNFQIITQTATPGKGAASSKQQWMSYNYQAGVLKEYGYGLSVQRTDTLYEVGGKFGLANAVGKGVTPGKYGFPIAKLYKKKDSPGLRAYSEVKEKIAGQDIVVGHLRVTMTPIGETGRIKTDIRFLNLEQNQHYYTFIYGVHSDLAGNHYGTPTYSLGNLNGLYVGIDGVTRDQITPDGQPYRVYFFKDGYPNEPSEFRPMDNILSAMHTSRVENIAAYWGPQVGSDKGFDPLARGISLSEDPGKGGVFKADHPIYSFKWEPEQVKPGERMDMRQDMAVTEENAEPEPPEPEPTFDLIEEVTHQDGTKADTAKTDELLHYKITLKNGADQAQKKDVQLAILNQKLDENLIDPINMEMKDSGGENIGKVTYNEGSRTITAVNTVQPINGSKDIIVEYDAKVKKETPFNTIIKEQTTAQVFEVNSNGKFINVTSNEVQTKVVKDLFSLIEEVTHQDGTKAETAKADEMLHYKITMKSEVENEDISYQIAMINQKLDENLIDPINMEMKDSDGNNIGKATYNEGSRMITSYNTIQPISGSKDITVEYDAKVKEETPVDTIIKGQATSEVFVVNSNGKSTKATSNEVQTKIIEDENGNLEFVSAPNSVSFGEELKVSSQDRTYSVQSTDGKLTVQDNRTVGQSWSMTAKLLTDMTSENGHLLQDSLHYYHKGQDYIFQKDTSLPVYEMVSTGNEPVNISDFWDAKQEGMTLKVKAGQAYAEAYKGSIQWTLQDVPRND